jgi:hypothetical protein
VCDAKLLARVMRNLLCVRVMRNRVVALTAPQNRPEVVRQARLSTGRQRRWRRGGDGEGEVAVVVGEVDGGDGGGGVHDGDSAGLDRAVDEPVVRLDQDACALPSTTVVYIGTPPHDLLK